MRAKRTKHGAGKSAHHHASLQIRCTSCGFTRQWTEDPRPKSGARMYTIAACGGCHRIHMQTIEEVPDGHANQGD